MRMKRDKILIYGRFNSFSYTVHLLRPKFFCANPKLKLYIVILIGLVFERRREILRSLPLVEMTPNLSF